jgi:hypothetical protein
MSSGSRAALLVLVVSTAGLALLEELPFGVCNEVVPLEEPTGL